MESQLLKQIQPELCSFSLTQNYNQTTYFLKYGSVRSVLLYEEKKAVLQKKRRRKQELQDESSFFGLCSGSGKEEKGVSGQQQKDEAVCSYLLSHPKPVSIYCRDGQTPAQDAQRGHRSDPAGIQDSAGLSTEQPDLTRPTWS